MAEEHIKINPVPTKVKYSGNGVVREFPTGFAFFEEDNIVVYHNGVIINTGYSVTGVGETDGGVVTFDVAPAEGDKIVIIRKVAIERVTDFQEGGAFRAKNINDELDRQTAFCQQIQEEIDRCVKVEVTDDQSPEELLSEVYGKLDSATEVAEQAIGAANQATTAAKNANDAVVVAQQQITETQEYVDAAKADVNNTRDEAVNTVNTTSSSAISTINTTVDAAKADITNTADNATGEITAAKDAAINAVEAAKIEIDNTKSSAIGTINSTVLTAETDIASTVTQAKADINTAVDEATMDISDTSTGAINTINTAVSNAEGNISTIVSDAEGSITNIAVTEANKAIANAAQEATDTATVNVNNYVNGTILPPLQTYVNQAQEDANSAATSMEQAALSATAASNYASNASADAGSAARSAALASADAGSAARSAELAQQIKDSLGNVYVYKGSVNDYSDLPSSATTGDVYNVVSNGKNYAWTGSAWDDLGGTVNLNEYQKTADADSKYATKTSLNSLSSAVSENSSNITSLQGSKQDVANLSQTIDTSTTKYPSNKAVVDYSAQRHQVVSVLPVNPDPDTFYYITEE